MTFTAFIVPRFVAKSVSIDEEEASSDARQGLPLQEPAWPVLCYTLCWRRHALVVSKYKCTFLEQNDATVILLQ